MKLYPHAARRWQGPPSFRRLFVLVAVVLATNSFTVPLPGQAPSRSVVAIDIKGAIGVATSEYIAQAIAKAESEGAQLLVIKLDTPGGLVSSTREIIKAILASRVPVAVYVSPSGAHAASAGTYIAYSAHIAAMAPGTNIGAATPVQISIPGLPTSPDPKRQPTDKPGTDQPSGTAMDRKALNDAIAFLRSLAQMRARNADWAEKSVRDAATLTASDALAEKVIDVVARDIADLLVQIDGRTVSTTLGS